MLQDRFASCCCVVVNVSGGSVAVGHAYVGLSRATSLEGLSIHNMTPKTIRANPKVLMPATVQARHFRPGTVPLVTVWLWVLLLFSRSGESILPQSVRKPNETCILDVADPPAPNARFVGVAVEVFEHNHAEERAWS